MDALKRKKHFWDQRHRAGHDFTPEHVWTFQLYQHFVDLGSYELNILYGFDLGRHLDGQPLQFMLKDRCAHVSHALLSFRKCSRKRISLPFWFHASLAASFYCQGKRIQSRLL